MPIPCNSLRISVPRPYLSPQAQAQLWSFKLGRILDGSYVSIMSDSSSRSCRCRLLCLYSDIQSRERVIRRRRGDKKGHDWHESTGSDGEQMPVGRISSGPLRWLTLYCVSSVYLSKDERRTPRLSLKTMAALSS